MVPDFQPGALITPFGVQVVYDAIRGAVAEPTGRKYYV